MATSIVFSISLEVVGRTGGRRAEAGALIVDVDSRLIKKSTRTNAQTHVRTFLPGHGDMSKYVDGQKDENENPEIKF